MILRYRVDCGVEFQSKGTWMKRCWTCWRAREDRKLKDDAYDRGYADGYREGAIQADAAYRNGIRDGARRASRRSLDADLLRGLVQLCHPDRHPPERSALANHATASLLDMLGRERSAPA